MSASASSAASEGGTGCKPHTSRKAPKRVFRAASTSSVPQRWPLGYLFARRRAWWNTRGAQPRTLATLPFFISAMSSYLVTACESEQQHAVILVRNEGQLQLDQGHMW